MPSNRFLVPVIASVTAVAVGVGAFFIALPFAQPTVVQPAFEPATALQPVSPLTDIDAPAESADATEADLEPTTAVTTADRGSPESFEAVMDARLRELDDISVVAEPDGTPAAPSDSLLVRDRATLTDVGVGITDPCVFFDAETAAERGCPPGAAGTVLGGDYVAELTLSANWGSRCLPSAPTATSHSFNIYSSEPVTLTVSSVVSGVAREITIVTTEADKAAWESDDTPGWITHCATLFDLPPRYADTVIIRGVTELGARAEITNVVNLRGSSEVPPSWVEPLSNSGVMMSIATKHVSTVKFAAFVVPYGQAPAPCDFDNIEGLTEPFTQVRGDLLPAERESGRYDDAYISRHTAGFIVPEASTISFCAGWFDSWAWEGNSPDHVYGEVLHSPDLAIPKVTVDSFTLDPAGTDRPERDIRMDFSVGDISGDELCGQWWTNSFADTAVCDYAVSGPMSPSWDLPLVVMTQVTAFGASAKLNYTFPIGPILCGYGCVPPREQYFDVPLDSRNPCLGNGCAPARAGSVRLRVDWVDGQDSWVDSWVRGGEATLTGDAPVFDRNAVVTLGEPSADGLTQDVQVRIDTDRPASFALSIEAGPLSLEFDREITDADFESTRLVTIEDVPTGSDYLMTLEVTGEDGATNVYSANPERGRTWAGGAFTSSRVALDVTATVEVSRVDGGEVTVGNYTLTAAGTTWTRLERGWDRFACDSGVTTIDLPEPTEAVGTRNPAYFILELEAFSPTNNRRASDCASQELPSMGRYVPVVTINNRLTVEQLRRGFEHVYNDTELIVTIRLSATT